MRSSGAVAPFDKNVFINCPFDKEYIELIRPLIFTILYLDYQPRIALESFDSGEARFTKICELIENSRLSIHDLSRIQASRKLEYYRLNMPFELGVDIGCRLFKSGKARQKKCLILEKEPYRYQKALSDLSGFDIKHHSNDPRNMVFQVRNWFVEVDHISVPSATQIWRDFIVFMTNFYDKRKSEGFRSKDLEMMPVPELMRFMRDWLNN